MMDVGMGASGTSAVDVVVICVRSVTAVLQTISDALVH
jgi:hypothetical protein